MAEQTAFHRGVTGEKQAEAYLMGQGMTVVARRIRHGTGEIDLVMQEGDTLVFVEVKYRPGAFAGAGLCAVSPDKMRRMTDCARHFLARQGWLEKSVRFDVLEITRSGILHIPNAFQGHEMP